MAIPNFARALAMRKYRNIVNRHPAAMDGQNPTSRFSIHGIRRNIGSEGITNQNTPVECAASFGAKSSCCARRSNQIQKNVSRETIGREAIKLPRSGLLCRTTELKDDLTLGLLGPCLGVRTSSHEAYPWRSSNTGHESPEAKVRHCFSRAISWS